MANFLTFAIKRGTVLCNRANPLAHSSTYKRAMFGTSLENLSHAENDMAKMIYLKSHV